MLIWLQCLRPARLFKGLLGLLIVLALGFGWGHGEGARAQQANVNQEPESSPAQSTGSLNLATVRILGVPVLTVASPEVRQGGADVPAQERAQVIEGNLAWLYETKQLCSRGEALAETFLDLGFLHRHDLACTSNAIGLGGLPEALTVQVKGQAAGPIELVAVLKGRQEPWPLLTVTAEDARWNGTTRLQLAQRWQAQLQSRLRFARKLMQPAQLLSRLHLVVLLELVLAGLLVIDLALWRRALRIMRSVDRQPPSLLINRPRWKQVALHTAQNACRGLLILAAVLVVLMVGVADFAVPGQLPVALDLLLQPGGLILKVVLLWLVSSLVRAVLAALLHQWSVNIDVPTDRRARRSQRHLSLQRVLGRLVDLAALVTGLTWILGDIPGIRQLSAGAVVAGGAVLGALAIVFQSLLRDFIAGLVVIFDDRYAIGDTVEIHGMAGRVTDVGLLSTELRCADQRVLVMQNSGFDQVVNHTKLRSGIDVRIPLSPTIPSLETALDLIAMTVQAFAQESEWSSCMLAAPLLRGVDEITPQGLVVSVLLTTKAGEQWAVKRALLHRLLTSLEQAGIPLAHHESLVP
jgi:small conductance mechanosensitive channel